MRKKARTMRLKWIALSFGILCLSVANAAQQAPPPANPPQDKEISGTISQSGFTRLQIAIPPCRSDAALSAQAAEITSTVSADLLFSGYFNLVDPTLWAGMNLGDTQVDFAAWQGMKADHLLMSSLRAAEGGGYSLEARLLDVKSKEMVTGKRIKGAQGDLRIMAHNLSSVVLDYLFGAGRIPTSQILFTSQVGQTRDIFLADYDGRNLLRLTALGILNVTPDVNLKGDRIAFTSILKDRQELFLLDRAGKRQKLYGEGEGLNASPRFSPDGMSVAFCTSKSGNPDVWVVGVDGKNLTRLTFSVGIDTAPTWSPDSQRLAFTSDRSGSPQIYLCDRDGANVRRLSPEGSKRCDQAVWSPKGDKIAYTTSVDGKFNLVVMDLVTNELTTLTHGEGDSESAAWSPDGRYLAFASNRSGQYQIYIMRSDGSGVTRITNQPDCYSPCWF